MSDCSMYSVLRDETHVSISSGKIELLPDHSFLEDTCISVSTAIEPLASLIS